MNTSAVSCKIPYCKWHGRKNDIRSHLLYTHLYPNVKFMDSFDPHGIEDIFDFARLKQMKTSLRSNVKMNMYIVVNSNVFLLSITLKENQLKFDFTNVYILSKGCTFEHSIALYHKGWPIVFSEGEVDLTMFEQYIVKHGAITYKIFIYH